MYLYQAKIYAAANNRERIANLARSLHDDADRVARSMVGDGYQFVVDACRAGFDPCSSAVRAVWVSGGNAALCALRSAADAFDAHDRRGCTVRSTAVRGRATYGSHSMGNPFAGVRRRGRK